MESEDSQMMMRKIKTGTPGLDKMLQGGLIEGRPYLVIGGPGAGKSILAMQFIMVSRLISYSNTESTSIACFTTYLFKFC